MARIHKTARNTLITVFVLVLLALLGGSGYVLFSDKSANDLKATSAASNPSSSSEYVPKPVAPGPNAPEGAAVEAVTTPVNVGSNSSITVSTDAGSNCSIVVSYNGVQSQDTGLVPKVADAYGNVTWAWTVGGSVSVGTYPIQVTCVYHGRSAVVTSSFQVTQ